MEAEYLTMIISSLREALILLKGQPLKNYTNFVFIKGLPTAVPDFLPLGTALLIELRCFRVEPEELLTPFSFRVHTESMTTTENSELTDDGRSPDIDRVSSCGESNTQQF